MWFLLKSSTSVCTVYIVHRNNFQYHSGGDGEDCGREGQVLGKPRFQQADEEKPQHVDWAAFNVNRNCFFCQVKIYWKYIFKILVKFDKYELQKVFRKETFDEMLPKYL